MKRVLHDLRAVVGTASAVAGMNAGLALALGLRLASGDRRAGANASAPAFDLALACAGVSLRVHGLDRLRAPRPAVYVFNHQSNLDPIVVCSLIRTDYTATGKAEAQKDPAGALAGIVLDAVFLDRDDTDAAKRSLRRVVDRVRGGESVTIAPEGTRRSELGPFKHGAFHVAAEAGVPVVPIVLRNTKERMGRGSKLIRPGVVDVAVLEPVAADRYEDAAAAAEAVHDRVAETLDRWPGA